MHTKRGGAQQMSVQTEARRDADRREGIAGFVGPVVGRCHDVVGALLPGLLLVTALGLAAMALAAIEEAAIGRVWLEALVLALLLGVLVRNVAPSLERCDAGAAYAGKQVLEFAVVLLGVSVNATALLASGARLALLIVAGVTTVLGVG